MFPLLKHQVSKTSMTMIAFVTICMFFEVKVQLIAIILAHDATFCKYVLVVFHRSFAIVS